VVEGSVEPPKGDTIGSGGELNKKARGEGEGRREAGRYTSFGRSGMLAARCGDMEV
jgi:hypothetical protein